MSESLYPTKTRLALLRDVADGIVYQSLLSENRGHCYADAGGPSGRRKVTAAVAEMQRVGWVRFAIPGRWSCHLELTDAGRAVLDAHGGTP